MTKIFTKVSEIRKELQIDKISSKKIAFVPTMGSLHDGHLALITKAKERAEIVVISIFVNPTQFNNKDDFKKYPRNNQRDIEKVKDCGVNYIFLPEISEIYPQPSLIDIRINDLTNCLCGKDRPGHFNGVCLVLTKLFNIIQPDFAIFGEKDFQQLKIVKKLVGDLDFPIEIIANKTWRCESGLAMSSRNERLNDQQLKIAAQIYSTLNQIKIAVNKNTDINLRDLLNHHKKILLNNGFDKIDYLEIRTEDDLKLITKFNSQFKSRIFFAGFINQVRLIDNLPI